MLLPILYNTHTRHPSLFHELSAKLVRYQLSCLTWIIKQVLASPVTCLSATRMADHPQLTEVWPLVYKPNQGEKGSQKGTF